MAMTIHLMIGPPCSGKTTEAKEMLKKANWPIVRVNRDELRKMMLGKIDTGNGYVETSINEITKAFVTRCVHAEIDIIVDATHCKAAYIREIKNMVPAGYQPVFKYVICDIPFWKQRWRNFWRWVKTGDWIPRDISIAMERNFRNTLIQIKTDKV